jgi:hypothetical protein
VKGGAKDADSALQAVTGDATSSVGGSVLGAVDANVPAVSTPPISTPAISTPSVTTPPLSTTLVTDALPEVDLPDLPVTTGELPSLP